MYKMSTSSETVHTGTYRLRHVLHACSLFSLIIVMLRVGKNDRSSKGIHKGSVLGPLFSFSYNINISYFGLLCKKTKVFKCFRMLQLESSHKKI